jgi:hypothetical protein
MKRSSTRKNKVYKYVHETNVSIKTNLFGRSYSAEWLQIDPDGVITVNGANEGGYAWDGCSPKANFLHFIWGTPDGKLDYRTERPMTYYASMIHDALYQYKKEIPISRVEADLLFMKLLRDARFMWWWLYGFAVIVGGMFYGRWKTTVSTRIPIRVETCSWLRSEVEATVDPGS